MKNPGYASVKRRSLPERVRDEAGIRARPKDLPVSSERLMERVLERDNLLKALRQVRRNRGSPGVDGMSVDVLPDYLRSHWLVLRESLERGTYQPKAVKRVEIPEPGGGMRQLGIPTVVDRFIQQALLQVLQAQWDSTFSDHSFGFRPGRSAHQAIVRAQTYIQGGYGVVLHFLQILVVIRKVLGVKEEVLRGKIGAKMWPENRPFILPTGTRDSLTRGHSPLLLLF